MGYLTEILMWSLEENEGDIKLNFVLNNSGYCERYIQTVSLYWEATIFTSDNGVLVLFCFLKTMFWAIKNQIFNCHSAFKR